MYPDYVLEFRFPLSTFKKALKEYEIGNNLLEDERYEEAANKFQKATEIDYNYVDAYYGWGSSLYGLKDYDDAIEKFRRCTILDPKYIDAYHNWAHALENIEEYECAIEKFSQCTKIDIKNIDARYCLGRLLYNLNRNDEAIEKFRQCIMIDSNDGFAYRQIGDILYYQGKYNEAKEEWKRAKDVYENKIQDAITEADVNFFSDFGKLLCCDLEELDEAKNIYKEGLKIAKDNIDILLGLAHLYISHDKDNYYGRIKFRKVVNLLKDKLSEKENSDLYLQLGKLYLDVGEYEDAEKSLIRAFEIDKESADICHNLGTLYISNEEFKKSIKYFKLALERDPDNLIIKRHLADAYFKEKLYYEAEKEYKEILDIAPYNVESLIGLGNLYVDMGDDSKNEDIYDDAITNFDKVIEITKSKSEKEKASIELEKEELANIYYSRGYAKVKTDLKGDAIKDFKDCLRNDLANDMAKRSKKKMEKEMIPLIQKIGIYIPNKFEKLCEILIFIFSIFMFIISWYLYYVGNMNINFLVIFSFGSLIFIGISPFLIHITKLKAPGMELEKNPFVLISREIKIEKPIHRR